LIGWVTRLADRYADRGITANAVAPGFIETAMTREMPAAVREVARRMNVFRQAGRPDDVAEAVVFLAAPFAQGINGDVLRVCGGAWLGE
jgi:3-oxoacyl-[acyl-carrier protein] reductase